MKQNIIEFPKISDEDITFGKIKNLSEWIKKANEAGFKFMDGNIYSNYSMKIFYNGGKLPKKKKNISDEYYLEGIRYFKCWLGSYNPKHEHKEEVTGYILSLISDDKWIQKELN